MLIATNGNDVILKEPKALCRIVSLQLQCLKINVNHTIVVALILILCRTKEDCIQSRKNIKTLPAFFANLTDALFSTVFLVLNQQTNYVKKWAMVKKITAVLLVPVQPIVYWYCINDVVASSIYNYLFVEQGKSSSSFVVAS